MLHAMKEHACGALVLFLNTTGAMMSKWSNKTMICKKPKIQGNDNHLLIKKHK